MQLLYRCCSGVACAVETARYDACNTHCLTRHCTSTETEACVLLLAVAVYQKHTSPQHLAVGAAYMLLALSWGALLLPPCCACRAATTVSLPVVSYVGSGTIACMCRQRHASG
jgi:hypothetical protein